jgi:hypothetical protein
VNREMADRNIDAMRRYNRLEIDLSVIIEIDQYGLHLTAMLISKK